MSARYVQLVPSKIDELLEPLGLDARAVFIDLLQRVDWRTRWYSLTLSDYSAYHRWDRGRMKKSFGILEGAGLVILSTPKGHQGSVEIPADVYESCVRMRSTSGSYADRMRSTKRENNKRT